MNLLLVIKFESSNALEAFFQMRLHTKWVLGLAQNLKKLVVGQEEEAREEQTLHFQVSVQAFLNFLQKHVGMLEINQHS